MPQHPFTTEPHEPEPWPEPPVTPWEQDFGTVPTLHGESGFRVLEEEDIARLEEGEADDVTFYADRGWSIGFGPYVPPSDYEFTDSEGGTA